MARSLLLLTLEHEVQHLSYFTAVGVLVAFANKQLNLDQEVYDQCLDTLVELLERVNDEQYRLTNKKPITPES